VISVKENHAIILPRDRVAIYNKNLAQYRGDLTSWRTYEAQEGENLAAIASKFGVPEGRLRQANRIPGNVRLVSAQTLLIPGPSGEGIRLNPADKTSLAQAGQGNTASTTTTTTPSRTATNAPTRTHTVRSGDTLGSIAQQYNTTVAALRALNNLKSDTLRAGARLRVPSATSRI
jgi:membrane-bound lytic murein transglycosylase D